MKKSAAASLLLVLVIMLVAALPAWGQEVVLGLGETYADDGLTVRCVQRAEPEVIVLTDCQFWDDFNEVCLYEKRTFRYGELSCIEECQHWDDFNDVCYFATECEFFPGRGAFVRTTCDVFDEVEDVCRRTQEDLIEEVYRTPAVPRR